MDVLVVGAGPAGIATAISLARTGLEVRVIDRARFPRHKPCAEYLSPGTLAELDRLGLLAAVERAGGAPLLGTAVIGPRGARLTGCFGQAGSRLARPTGLSLSRWQLDATLVATARALGVEIIEGTAVEQLVHHQGAVAGAVVRQGDVRRSWRARLVIGADGLRSVVARAIGGRVHRWPSRMAIVTHLQGVTAEEGMAQMHVGLREYVGIHPIGGGRTNVAMVLPTSRLTSGRGTPAARLAVTLGQMQSAAPALGNASSDGPVWVTGPFGVRSRRIVVDGAMLVGDAAEFFDPFTGEGIGTALQGGRLAAEAAEAALHAGQPATARRLRPYLRARRTAFAGKWAVERLIGWGLQAPAVFDRCVERLERHGHGHTLVGVTGQVVPPSAILNLRVLAALMR